MAVFYVTMVEVKNNKLNKKERTQKAQTHLIRFEFEDHI